MIVFDVKARRLDIEQDAATLQERLADWVTPEPRYQNGVMAKYARLVGSAAAGAIT
jgi:dihydroxy-acid dehydratase